MYRRFAIYVTPDGALARTGASWLGWDIATGRPVPQPDIADIDVPALTKRPRRYGLHATIKPPMVLAAGCSGAELIAATERVAADLVPVALEAVRVTQLGRFLALTPVGDQTMLNAMAAGVVERLDHFRAPASEEELARRRKRPLSPSQEDNLVRWGYPNVMEDFRFHITLTGPHKHAERIAPLVAAHFAPALPCPFVIDHLTVAGEDTDGMFHSIARLRLGG